MVETLLLDFRPPFDSGRLLAFLGPRALPGIEEIDDRTYRRPLDGVELRVEERSVAVLQGGPGTVGPARSLLDLDAGDTAPVTPPQAARRTW